MVREQSLRVALAAKKRPEFARGIVGVVDLVVAFLGLGCEAVQLGKRLNGQRGEEVRNAMMGVPLVQTVVVVAELPPLVGPAGAGCQGGYHRLEVRWEGVRLKALPDSKRSGLVEAQGHV